MRYRGDTVCALVGARAAVEAIAVAELPIRLGGAAGRWRIPGRRWPRAPRRCTTAGRTMC